MDRDTVLKHSRAVYTTTYNIYLIFFCGICFGRTFVEIKGTSRTFFKKLTQNIINFLGWVNEVVNAVF